MVLRVLRVLVQQYSFFSLFYFSMTFSAFIVIAADFWLQFHPMEILCRNSGFGAEKADKKLFFEKRSCGSGGLSA